MTNQQASNSNNNTKLESGPSSTSIRETTMVELKIVITMVLFAIGATWTVVSWAYANAQKTNPLANGLDKEISVIEAYRALSEPLKLVSLGDSDAQLLMKLFEPILSKKELAEIANIRGWRVYAFEKKNAKRNANKYSIKSIRQALYWFEKANRFNEKNGLAIWNTASMYALLGDATTSLNRLRTYDKLPHENKKNHISSSKCKDTDYCPVMSDLQMSKYMREAGCLKPRNCPKQPIQVE